MTDTTAPPAGPPLTGQDINLAASATRRVLVEALVPLDLTFEQWTVLNQVGTGRVGDEAAMAELFRRGLQLADDRIEAVFAGLADADLVFRGDAGALALTAHGREVFDRGATAVAELVADLYAGFDPDDLVRARQILVELTARAEARLAAA